MIDRVPPQPRPPAPGGSLPRALTFFLSAGERGAVLRALRRRSGHGRREEALLEALGIGGGSSARGACRRVEKV